MADHARLQVFSTGHPQGATELARQPAGHSDVVRVQVRAEDAGQRASCQRPLWRDQGAPEGLGLLRVHARIEQRPAPTIAHRPDVDVRQGRRQGKANPQDAGRDPVRLPGSWGASTWKLERRDARARHGRLS
ncbi:hypothetical protein D3C87_1528430 [compost metagenome]